MNRHFMSGLALLLSGMAAVHISAYASGTGGGDEAGKSFKDFDANKDGQLTLEEFTARGKDDLMFKAADINGDEQVDREEFDAYRAKKAKDGASAPAGVPSESAPRAPVY